MIGVTLFIIAVLVITIYVLVEIKRLRHKVFAIFLIALILFSYISAAVVFKGKNIDYKTIPGVIESGKIYFSWLLGVFGNFWTITTYAVKMDWSSNETSIK